ncbi:hypothetical protein ONS95_002675 [Cadophora gregata]|uniref:uncharacterized protein n=1 Tax=Cadophora gregata TaxID=51156 RepID=UPI0026DADC8C|nr:uncharacterized protein ONS95_002675 [Cadophora gregata]KAK0110013.1 hypothetical protein ONS95_002675 [Cadophora gregata]KAK0110365.1 hypothetical protein ONS96_001980 [Cadophora gregata f. sp. sojae]
MLPFLKRLLLPLAGLCFICILLEAPVSPDSRYASQFFEMNDPLRVPISHSFTNTSTHRSFAADEVPEIKLNKPSADYIIPVAPSGINTVVPQALLHLTTCPRSPNRFTGHIRLPNPLFNISMDPPSTRTEERRTIWNPTIFALPYWADNQYIIVSMVVAHGEAYRRNVLCEASFCRPKNKRSIARRERICTEDDLRVLGPNGGLRCVTTPIEVDVPPTPAERCSGMEQVMADIAGFHDPRLFYSGRGEPILMVVSQSRYACIGLWAIDLRVIYPTIQETFASSPRRLGPGPLISYSTLTELTRNPPSTRQSYEKNWVMFFPSPATSYLQYELNSTTRTFAQLIGGGLTTQNMTDPFEKPCLADGLGETETDIFTVSSSWHQATPALKLVLCTRSNTTCIADNPTTVFFAAIQRKHNNGFGLPIRYERYFVIWSATWPFNMLAVSQNPILLANETNRGWKPAEIWDDVPEAEDEKRGIWGDFTYTTTIAYAWGRAESDIREKGTGYLDDEVILSVGIDDNNGLYGKVVAADLLQCLRICPGRS